MWQTLSDHPEVFYGGALAFGIVVLLTPAVGGMARLLGVVDRPDKRRLNRRTIPRLGGLALFFGIFVPALAFRRSAGRLRACYWAWPSRRRSARSTTSAGSPRGRSSAGRLLRRRFRPALASGCTSSRSRSSGRTYCLRGSAGR